VIVGGTSVDFEAVPCTAYSERFYVYSCGGGIAWATRVPTVGLLGVSIKLADASQSSIDTFRMASENDKITFRVSESDNVPLSL
jgi:hypothetical protein